MSPVADESTVVSSGDAMKLDGRRQAQGLSPATGRNYRLTAAVLLALMSASVAAQDGTLLVVSGDHQAGSISFFDLATEVEVVRCG